MNRIGDDLLTGEKNVSVGRSRRRCARRFPTDRGRVYHEIAAGAGERLRGDGAISQADSFAPFPPSSTAFSVLINTRGDASGGGVRGRGGIFGGPRTVATPLCGVPHVHFAQQAHGGTVLCVRDAAFRVEYCVLLDKKTLLRLRL